MEDAGLDPQLWHACSGAMVQIPPVNSKVYYFPQGHAEHAQGVVDFGTQSVPALIPCCVNSVQFMADQETDEVYAKIRMTPLKPDEMDLDEEDDGLGFGMNAVDAQGKPTSFAKTLTQSDANNGGGFSVPRYCAETIFPTLDYSEDPPVQMVCAKDVHGEIWKFRHIYRGTPRRHLLTTGWSTFVNHKKLVAGDSIVFLRAEDGELCVGIRRGKRWGISGGSVNSLNGSNLGCGAGMRGKGRVRAEAVVEAATLAANGQPFEVVYYPRTSTPEFCVKAATVNAALKIQWSTGMRFKMAFDTEDSSRISWFMGTISSVHIVDPIRWPNSPWRLLQVTWDEPDLLQNVKCVNPWLVELVSDLSSVHLTTFSPPRKKPRIPQHPDFPFEDQFPTPVFPGNPIGPSESPLCCFPNNTPADIQGARHAQFGLPLSDLHLQSGLFPLGFHWLDHTVPPSQLSSGVIVGNPAIQDNVSHLLTIGNSSESLKKPSDEKPQQLVLFGKLIQTEQQMPLSNSINIVSHGATVNNSSNDNLEKPNVSDGSGSAHIGHTDSSSPERFQCFMDDRTSEQNILNGKVSELSLETGLCAVFLGSENVGRALNLSAFECYEELYSSLSGMFRIDKSKMMNHVLYEDAAGEVKHIGEERFSVFMKEARKLIILTDSSSNNIGRSSIILLSKFICGMFGGHPCHISNTNSDALKGVFLQGITVYVSLFLLMEEVKVENYSCVLALFLLRK